MTFFTSLANEELPATKAAADDAAVVLSVLELESVTLTLRTTRGEGWSSCRGALAVVLLTARARAAARTAVADFGVRLGRLRVGRIGGADVGADGAGLAEFGRCADWWNSVLLLLLLLLLLLGNLAD